MVTAKTQSDDLVKALALGANDYVTKPVDIPVLFARVDIQLSVKDAECEVRRANDALQRANHLLEQRVAERTVDLMEVNRQLQLEMAERERSAHHIRYLAHHDALTGLGNRTLLHERMEELRASSGPAEGTLAVLFLDLDGFKQINDTRGHSVGDATLKCVAERLRENVGDNDRVVRLGGDEFAILQIAKEQPTSAATLARRLIHVISQPILVHDHEVAVGVSIGIAIAGGPEQDQEQLLRFADLAMYQAKAEGKRTFRFFEPELDRRAQLHGPV
jgi:diguanylate cyclase (GGDEF)-like protein